MKAKTALGAGLVALAVALAAEGFYAVNYLRHAKIDLETLCPAEGAKAITLVIVDKTDPLSPPEQARASEIVATERDAAKRGDRIVVSLLSESGAADSAALTAIADLCNPGTPGSEVNLFLENPKRAALRYSRNFIEPIGAAMASVASEDAAHNSPIVRSIDIALAGLHAPSKTPIRLILVSDLMEHGPDVSAYSGALSEKALHGLISSQAVRRLYGANVEIALLSRPRYEKQQKAAVSAWRRFFADATGREPAIGLR
jgi:hypothetical protein